jgi:hypothetical protein
MQDREARKGRDGLLEGGEKGHKMCKERVSFIQGRGRSSQERMADGVRWGDLLLQELPGRWRTCSAGRGTLQASRAQC